MNTHVSSAATAFSASMVTIRPWVLVVLVIGMILVGWMISLITSMSMLSKAGIGAPAVQPPGELTAEQQQQQAMKASEMALEISTGLLRIQTPELDPAALDQILQDHKRKFADTEAAAAAAAAPGTAPDNMLVFMFTSKCPHCVMLFPEWLKLVEIEKPELLELYKVDSDFEFNAAQQQQQQTGQSVEPKTPLYKQDLDRVGINTIQTPLMVLWSRGKDPVEYKGERTAQKMVEWFRTQTGGGSESATAVI